MTRPEERGAREIKRHLCDSHFYHYVNKHPAPWCHKVGVHKNVYVCFSSQQGKMGSVEGRGRGEKKMISLTLCNAAATGCVRVAHTSPNGRGATKWSEIISHVKKERKKKKKRQNAQAQRKNRRPQTNGLSFITLTASKWQKACMPDVTRELLINWEQTRISS